MFLRLEAVLFVVVIFLTACGGSGGGGGNGSSLLDQDRVSAACGEAPSTQDPFMITSYYACGVDNTSLSGVWMLTADYDVIANNYHFDGVLRMGITIKPSNPGKLEVTSCGYFRGAVIGKSQFEVSEDTAFIDISDPVTAATIRMNVDDELHLSGQHIDESDVSITRSSAAARKITGDYTKSIALLDLQFEYEGESFYGEGIGIDCFAEYRGERQNYLLNTIPSGAAERWQELSFTSLINFRYPNQPVHLLVVTPGQQEVEGGGVIFGPTEAISYLQLESDDSTSFQLVVDQDDEKGIRFSTIFEDLISVNNTAAFGAQFIF